MMGRERWAWEAEKKGIKWEREKKWMRERKGVIPREMGVETYLELTTHRHNKQTKHKLNTST